MSWGNGLLPAASSRADVTEMSTKKTLKKVPHFKLLHRIKEIWIKGRLFEWIKQWLSYRQQRVVINYVTSEWTPVTSGVPQGSVLGPVLFIIYINDIDLGLNNFISKFAVDTNIGNALLSEGDRWSLQEDLRKISDWSVKWEISFNINVSQILQVRSSNINTDYGLRGVKVKSVHLVKDYGVSVTSNLKFSEQCKESVIKANMIIGLIKRNFPFKNKDFILPWYSSFVRPHLEYAVQLWFPHCAKDIA